MRHVLRAGMPRRHPRGALAEISGRFIDRLTEMVLSQPSVESLGLIGQLFG